MSAAPLPVSTPWCADTPEAAARRGTAPVPLPAPPHPSVAVIVLNWNGGSDTLACLESLGKLDYPNARVMVVDNGSTDDSVEAIRRRHPDIRLMENGANLGFAGGNNPGIQAALDEGYEYVLLLNNDTVVDSALVTAFVEAAQAHPRAGVFGAKILCLSEPQRLWHAGGYWNDDWLNFVTHGAGEIDQGQFDTPRQVDWVVGCAFFVRASVFRELGLLAPAFFLNFEEIDFCSRARRHGYACQYVPRARLWHRVSASMGGETSPMRVYFNTRNRLLWARRNTRPGLRWRIYAMVTRYLWHRVAPALRGRRVSRPWSLRKWLWSIAHASSSPETRAMYCGWRDFWLGRFGDCPVEIRALSARGPGEPSGCATPTGPST